MDSGQAHDHSCLFEIGTIKAYCRAVSVPVVCVASAAWDGVTSPRPRILNAALIGQSGQLPATVLCSMARPLHVAASIAQLYKRRRKEQLPPKLSTAPSKLRFSLLPKAELPLLSCRGPPSSATAVCPTGD